eukprot:4024815-Karenia_brevis.AAC.1
MHAADLGILAYLLGEVFWGLLMNLSGQQGGPVGMKRLSGLRNLKARLKQFYKDHSVSSRVPLK